MSIKDKKQRIQELRQNVREIEGTVNRGAVLLGELQDEIERAEQGLDYNTTQIRERVLPSFEEYYRIRFTELTGKLRRLFGVFRLEFDEYRDILQETFNEGDQEALATVLSDLRETFPAEEEPEIDELFCRLRRALQNEDVQQFESGLDELEERYDPQLVAERFESTRKKLASTVTELTDVQEEVKGLSQQLEESLTEYDEQRFETTTSDVEGLFEDRVSDLLLARIEAIEEALTSDDHSQIETEIQRFRDDLRALIDKQESTVERLRERKRDLLAGTFDDPSKPYELLESSLQPALLLPVQLETRFIKSEGKPSLTIRNRDGISQVFQEPTSGEKPSLAIRVYPDDIHIDTHEPELTDDEFVHGRQFWETIWWVSHNSRTKADLEKELQSKGKLHLISEVDFDSLPVEPEERHRAVKERAWNRLVQRFGENRAAWVKERLAPQGADTLLSAPVNPSDVPSIDFDAMLNQISFRPDSWTRPPQARLLPDQWIAFVSFENDDIPSEILLSKPVREPLIIGPRPDPIATTGTETDSIAAGIGDGPTAWMTDFEEAKAAGMAMEMTLPQLEGGNGNEEPAIEEIVVTGVKSSMTPSETASEFRNLLEAHHYTDGLDILRQGTATNNTEDDQSGYSSETDSTESLAIQCQPTGIRNNPAMAEASDGELMAQLLAIDPTDLGAPDQQHVFSHVRGATQTEQRNARHMNTALWSATWGYYVPHMLTPYGWLEDTRTGEDNGILQDKPWLFDWLNVYSRHFADYVRARGPLPPLRIGRQPYGILPITLITAGTALQIPGGQEDNEPVTPRDLEQHLTRLVSELRLFWGDHVDQPPITAMQWRTNLAPDLLEVLGMEAGAYGYRYREAIGENALGEGLKDSLSSEELMQLNNLITSDASGTDIIVNAQRMSYDEFERVRIHRLLNRGPYSQPLNPLVTDDGGTLRFLLTESFEVIRRGFPEIQNSDWATSEEVFEGMPLSLVYTTFLGYRLKKKSLHERLLLYATLHEYVAARIRLADTYGRKEDDQGRIIATEDAKRGWRAVPEPERYGLDPEEPEKGLLDLLDDPIPDSLADVHEVLSIDDTTYGDALDAVKGLYPDEMPSIDRRFETFIGSLDYLKNSERSSEETEQLLTETLDLASYRLDAWATSIATKRLSGIRAHQKSASATSPGLYIGAYGYVTNIQKRLSKEQSDGYIHAPSPHHATTAAVLRSGFHSFGDADTNPAAVNISPDRVRKAIELIEGVREGTSLNELLGYRFERELHEHGSGLDKYIPAFRAFSPLSAGNVDQEEEAPISGPDARRDIVDGLKLVRLSREEGTTIPWGSGLGIPKVSLPSESDPDADAIRGILAILDEALDAVSDVLTAEGVHQLVGGNPTRAGGSLDALARGEAPPELRVTQTPRSGTGLTHRVLILFGDEVPRSEWSVDDKQARAGTEPRLNAWVERLLPDPETVICLCTYQPSENADKTDSPLPRKAVRLSDLEVSPLDVLYGTRGTETGQRSDLDQRVIYHLKRSRELPVDTQIAIEHGSVRQWSTEYDPADITGITSFDGLVGFDELLEIARRIRDVTGSGRAASARDLRLAETAGEEDIDMAKLQNRRTRVRSELAEIRDRFSVLTRLQTPQQAVDGIPAPANIELSEFDKFENVAVALERLGGEGYDLKGLAKQISGLTSTIGDVVSNLQALATWAGRAELVVATTDNGVIELETGATTYIPGRAIVDREVEIKIQYVINGRTDSFSSFIETTRSSGEFIHQFDGVFYNLEPGMESFDFEIRFQIPDLGINVTYPARIVKSAQQLTTADDLPEPARRPETEALDEFLTLFWELEEFSSAISGNGSIMAAYSEVDLQALEVTADHLAGPDFNFWSSTDQWPWNEREAIGLLLSLPGSPLPGFAENASQLWTVLADFIREFDLRKGEDAATFDQGTTTNFKTDLETYLDGFDETVDTARLGGTLNRFATDLRRLNMATEVGIEGYLMFRASLLEFLRDTLHRASYFGIHGSLPRSATGWSAADQEILARQTASVAQEIKTRLDQVPEKPDAIGEDTDAESERLVQDIQTLFGESFCVLPSLSPMNSSKLSQAMDPNTEAKLLKQNTDEADTLEQVDTWFQRTAHVRDHVDKLQTVLVYADALGEPTVNIQGQTRSRLHVAQLPYDASDTWVGLSDAWTDDPTGGKLSIVYHEGSPVDSDNPPIAGLFIDEWTETVPGAEETTGLAFQYEAPNNCPPQSMLLGVPETDDGWSLKDLKELVGESIEWAQLRTVDVNSNLGETMGQFLPALFFANNTDEKSPRGPKTPSINFDNLRGGGK